MLLEDNASISDCAFKIQFSLAAAVISLVVAQSLSLRSCCWEKLFIEKENIIKGKFVIKKKDLLNPEYPSPDRNRNPFFELFAATALNNSKKDWNAEPEKALNKIIRW